MSDIRYNGWLHRSGTGGVWQDSSGRVGIGSSVPSYMLQAQTSGTSTTAGGNIVARFQSNAAGRDATIQLSDNVSHSATISMLSSAFIVKQAGAETVRIDSSGNMGLGGAPIAPGHLTFHMNNGTSSAATRFHMTTNSTGATASDGFSLSIDGSSSDVNLIQRESANMRLYTAGSERFRIRADGRVSIASSLAVTGICTAATFVPTEGQLSNRNIVINGDMRIAQRGTSTTSINEYLVDRWRSYGGALGATWSQQTDATAYPRSRYALRQHRTASNSQTNNTGVGQGIETKNSLQLAGQTVTLSFKARCGANFSASSNYLTSRINGGEGTDENPFGMTNTNGDAQNNTLTTSVQRFTHTWTIPSDKTQITVLFDYTPVGTAGAQDWFEIAEVQLEVGSVATPFEHRSYGDEFLRCARYCYVISEDAIGMGAQKSSTQIIGSIKYPATMRSSPTATSDSLDLRIDSGEHLVTSSSGTFTLSETGISITGYKMTGFTSLSSGSAFFVKHSAGSLTLSAEL